MRLRFSIAPVSFGTASMALSSKQSSSNLERDRSSEAPAASLGGGSASGGFSIRSTTSCRLSLGPVDRVS